MMPERQTDKFPVVLNIRQKILLSLFIVLGGSLLLTLFVFEKLITPAISELELMTAEGNASRVVNAMQQESEQLATVLADWSSWDDTYRFVAGEQPRYVESNLGYVTFTALTMNLFAAYDMEGRLVWGRFYDLATGESKPLDEFVSPLQPPLDKLLLHPDEPHVLQGFLQTKHGLLLLASRPILNSWDEGPRHGTVIMGRLLSEQVLHKMQTRIAVPFNVLAAGVVVAGESAPATPAFAAASPPAPADAITIFEPLLDPFGARVALIRIRTPMQLTLLGMRVADLGLGTLLVASILVIILLSMIFHYVLFRPLADLTRHVISIRRFSDLGRRLSMERRDEIGMLAGEFDALLGHLQETQGKLMSDFMSAKTLSQELAYQAAHDGLTDLLNRRELEKRLAKALETARLGHRRHVLCYLDLDQFELINDTCGHTGGDEMLKQLGAVLRNTVRSRDSLGRMGGDEFVVLLEDCTIDQALRLAEALQKAIRAYRFRWQDHEFPVGLNVGLAAIDGGAEDVRELLIRGDAACFAAKQAGDRHIHVYSEQDQTLLKRRGEIYWAASIEQYIRQERVCIMVQPIKPLSPVTRIGEFHELLVRMRDDNGELVDAEAFLPALEKYARSQSLDRWVVKTALQRLQADPRACDGLFLCAINLSGQSISDPGFLQFVLALFRQTGICPGKICFEITETSAITHYEGAMRFFKALKQIGCRFALDDFGTGLSSFAYLKTLPVDFIKIDGAFVRDIGNDPVSLSMVKSINEIGKVMGLQTIAEYVEEEAVLIRLRELGVDFAQGNYLGKPYLLYADKSDTATV